MSTQSATSLRHLSAAGVHFIQREGAVPRPTVFLHGIGGNAASFATVMTQWPVGPRLMAWDAPGYDQSHALDAAWPTAEDYANRLAEALSKLQVDQIDLVGQSLGGLIAATFAARFPDAVRKLILVSPAHGYSVPPGGPLTEALAKRVADFDAEGAVAFAAKRAPRLVFLPERNPHVAQQVRDAMAMLSNPGHTQAVKVLASGDLLSLASQLPHQILLVSGYEDVITPLAGTEALLGVLRQRPRLYPDSEGLIVIPNAGHAAYLEAPSAFIQYITAFQEQAP